MSEYEIQPTDPDGIFKAEQHADAVRRRPTLPSLSDEHMKLARELSRSLIRSEDHLDDIVTFGIDAQNKLAQLSRDMLKGVRSTSLDEVIQLSDGVLTEINTLSLADLGAARRYMLFLRESQSAIRHRIEKFFKRYELVNTRLDRADAEIFRKETDSTQRYYASTELERATYDVMVDARIKLAAIQLFLDGDYGYVELDRRRQLVADEKAAAASEGRSIDYLIVASADRYARYIDRLETKKATLDRLILTSFQAGITIGMMRHNENIIRQKLSDVRIELMPQWRMMFALAYNAYQQRGIAEMVHRLAEAEANLRRATADAIEQSAAGVAELMQRPLSDEESLIYFNDKLLHSLETLKKASVEARKIRASAEAFNAKIIGDLESGLA